MSSSLGITFTSQTRVLRQGERSRLTQKSHNEWVMSLVYNLALSGSRAQPVGETEKQNWKQGHQLGSNYWSGEKWGQSREAEGRLPGLADWLHAEELEIRDQGWCLHFHPQQLADGWYLLLRAKDWGRAGGRGWSILLRHAKSDKSLKHPVVAKQRQCVKRRAWPSRSFCRGARRWKGWTRPLAPTPNIFLGSPSGSFGKESACNVEDLGSVPGLGRSPGEGNDNPLQYSCLENSMDRGAWWLQSTGLQELDTTERLWLLLQKTFQECEKQQALTRDSYVLSLPPPRFPFQPKGRAWVRRREGKVEGQWEKTVRDPKAQKTRALPPEPHATLFIALLASGSGSFLSNIKIPIKDDNVFSLNFFFY